MFTHIALLTMVLASPPTIRYPRPEGRHPAIYRPRIELWTSRGDGAVYTRGERVRVFFKLDTDAFVTIFRVDTDGRVRVLFPREPWEDSFARGGREFEIDGQRLHSDAFTIDDYPGVGYLFAVASADPFVYDGIESGDHWDYRVIADGRVRGDPYVAMTDLAQRIVPEGYEDWDYDVVSYNVERHYDYPRFLCYDCHSYVSYSYWDPYYASCVRFRMVIYDDPWYYPYRYYGGTRVVFVRPYRPQPRFIFKNWDKSVGTRETFIARERERPVNDDTRRGITGRDIGRRGVVPPPDIGTRRDRSGQFQPDRMGRVSDNRGAAAPVIRRSDAGSRQTDDRDTRSNDDRRTNRGTDDRGTRGIIDRGKQASGDRGTASPEIEGQRPMVVPPQDEPRRVEPRRAEPRRIEPRVESQRQEPRRVEPRSEPRREEPRRIEPRREEPRRAEPQRSSPPPAPARAEPRREAPREKPSNEPEVRRRKP